MEKRCEKEASERGQFIEIPGKGVGGILLETAALPDALHCDYRQRWQNDNKRRTRDDASRYAGADTSNEEIFERRQTYR